MKSEIKKDEGRVIDEFLKEYPSKSTVRAYRLALNKFFQCIHYDPDEYFKEKNRNYENDVKTFFLELNGKPPKTIRTQISCVKIFLSENDIDLPEKFWRRLRRKIRGTRALTIDKVPSNEELRSIITHMDAKGKALFLTLSSSGMRIGEALQINIHDIDLNSTPPHVNISGEYTKTGNSRIAFISNECKEALVEWFKVRAQYLKCAVGRSHKYRKKTEDQKLFPFQNTTALTIWNNAVKKAGLEQWDTTTHRHTLHPHVLRKYFRTKMGSIIPVDVAEALMGHEGYLTMVYRKYSVEQLGKFYREGEGSISVFTELSKVHELKEEMKEKNRQLHTVINGLATENVQLKETVHTLERDMQKFKKIEDSEIYKKLVGVMKNDDKLTGDVLKMMVEKALEKNPELLFNYIKK